VAVLIGGSDFRIYTVEADRDLHLAMIDREREFWRLVETDTMPEPVDAREVQALFAKDNGRTVQAIEAVYMACQRLKAVKDNLKQIDAEKDLLEGHIKHAIGEAAALELDGMTLATWKAAKDSSLFDTDAFKAAHPELFAQYLKSTPGSRRFLLK
jgi:predicted phage-related endonuclease